MIIFGSTLYRDYIIKKYKIENLEFSNAGGDMFMPLQFRMSNGDWWTFPIEPLISLSGGNVITRRNVAKSEGRGTIKERWAEDDFSISIQASFVDSDLKSYPENEMQDLYNIITQRGSIEVRNDLLQMLNIHRVVIEAFEFPFSKGENVQNFSLSGYSDDFYELFIEVNNV